MAYAAEKGVTSVHDVSGEAGFDIYQELLQEGKLTARIYFYVPDLDGRSVLRMKLRTGFGNDFLALRRAERLRRRLARLRDRLFLRALRRRPQGERPSPRADVPGRDHGEADSRPPTGRASRCAIHAIGDRANAIILDIFDEAEAENGPRDRRFRIEHAQHLRPADIARFAKLEVIASVQPYHAIDDGRWAEKKDRPRAGRKPRIRSARSWTRA